MKKASPERVMLLFGGVEESEDERILRLKKSKRMTQMSRE